MKPKPSQKISYGFVVFSCTEEFAKQGAAFDASDSVRFVVRTFRSARCIFGGATTQT